MTATKKRNFKHSGKLNFQNSCEEIKKLDSQVWTNNKLNKLLGKTKCDMFVAMLALREVTGGLQHDGNKSERKWRWSWRSKIEKTLNLLSEVGKLWRELAYYKHMEYWSAVVKTTRGL